MLFYLRYRFRRVVFVRRVLDLAFLLLAVGDTLSNQAEVGNRPNSFGRIPRTRGCQAQG